MNWILKKLLKLHKTKVLLETETDMRFIHLHRKDALDFDEKKARKEYREEKEKPEEKQDKGKLAEISFKIAEHNAVRKELSTLTDLRADIERYIKLL